MSRDRKVMATFEGRALGLSNLEKILYPAVGFTKGQVIDYYVRIAPVMLDHIGDRPVTLRRFVDGVDGPAFFEKHVPASAPDWLRTVTVRSTSKAGSGATVEYPLLGDVASLAWAANLASLEFHVPLWHVGKRRKLPASPDHLVFDLDPGPGTSIVECCTVAALVHEHLQDQGRVGFAKTSGSKGLQVYSPLRPGTTWQQIRDHALKLARELEASHPQLVVSNMRRALRAGKVLIDWSQNHPAKTTVAAYSLRARAEPTVSTPVTWEEVAACERSSKPEALSFSSDEVLSRVQEAGDLFAPLGLVRSSAK